jgi:hypothetical protein
LKKVQEFLERMPSVIFVEKKPEITLPHHIKVIKKEPLSKDKQFEKLFNSSRNFVLTSHLNHHRRNLSTTLPITKYENMTNQQPKSKKKKCYARPSTPSDLHPSN